MKDIKSEGDERASPEGFITLHGFMMKGMGLSGVPLLVFARIYGFNSAGLDFYESKPHLASFLNTTEMSVYRAFSDLLEKGLIQESGSHRHASGAETKCYSVVWSAIPPRARGPDPDKTTPPDKTSPPEILSVERAQGDDESSVPGLTNCQPIRKADNKGFR